MISIIICSRKSDISSTLKENIQHTIGCEYELVIIDNSQNKYSIFTAYNEGVSKSQGDILCFMHDDILYHTNGWGKIISQHFQNDKELGVIGVAGAQMISDAPLYWTYSPFKSERFIINDNGNTTEWGHDVYLTFDNNNTAEVAVVDGLCFFVPKILFANIRFDDINYNGFHAYDMDICMQVHQIGYKVTLCNTLLIEHFWSDKFWTSSDKLTILEKQMSIFTNKWKDQLPFCKGLDFITPTYLIRLNDLMRSKYETRQIRNSKTYKLGKFLLLFPKKTFKILQSHNK